MMVRVSDRVYFLAIGKRERVARFAARLLPRRVAYWAAIRVGVHATTGKYSNQVVPELTIGEMLERWDLS